MDQQYQPLHHKYRPDRLDHLIGQQAIAATLKQALRTNRIAPAYLFSGPRGTGKTSSARILAKSLNCLRDELPTINPCGRCELCKTISSGTALDVIEIDAASNTGVENIRELIERSRFAPVQARWKVYVIDECHMLSTAAFNALLKTLEEPPPKVVFVLATTDPQRVIPTILSRCMRFDFRRIGLEDISDHLTMIADKEKIEIESEAIFLIARRSEGGLRDAESMLDQLSLLPSPIKKSAVWNLLGAVPEEKLLQLATAILKKEPRLILSICRDLLDQGKEPIAILQGLASILRDLVLQKSAPEHPNLCNSSSDIHSDLTQLANSITLECLFNLQANLKGSESQLRNSMQPRLWLEVILLGMLSTDKYEKQTNKNIAKTTSSQTMFKSIKEEDTKTENNNFEKQINKKQKEETSKINENQNLDQIWEKILTMLELPSTKMLLSQQARLLRVTDNAIEISVSQKWISMIESRSKVIEEAVTKSLGSHKNVIFKRQSESIESGIKEVSKPPKNDSKNYEETKRKENPKVINNASIKKNSNLLDKRKDTSIEDKTSLDNKAKNLASFFNGQVINLD